MVAKSKILFIHHGTGVGGAPISMVNLIKKLDKDKYDAEILLIKKSSLTDYLDREGVSYEIIDHPFYKNKYKYYTHTQTYIIKWWQIGALISRYLLWKNSNKKYAWEVLKDREYDILHLNSSVLTDWIKPGSRKGKVVIHIREPLAKGYFGIRAKFFREQIEKFASHVIAISKDNSNRLGLPGMTTVVYNFIPIPEKSESGVTTSPGQKMEVLYLGGTAKIKGFYTVVNCLKYLDKDIKIIFGGNIGFQTGRAGLKNKIKEVLMRLFSPKLYNAIRTLHQSENVEIAGYIPNVKDYLKKSAFLISPFSVEHFSRPVIESFAFGKPAIGTNVVGMNEIIDNDLNGFIVEKDNPKSLAEKINFFFRNPDKIKEMGANGYEKAVREFSPENVRKVEKIYDELTR